MEEKKSFLTKIKDSFKNFFKFEFKDNGTSIRYQILKQLHTKMLTSLITMSLVTILILMIFGKKDYLFITFTLYFIMFFCILIPFFYVTTFTIIDSAYQIIKNFKKQREKRKNNK